jgi:hypothetical protein
MGNRGKAGAGLILAGILLVEMKVADGKQVVKRVKQAEHH